MIDQTTLLSSVRLTLPEEISQNRIGSGRVVLKHIPSGSYLTLSKTERTLLDYFKNPTKLSEALPQLINDRKCPPLREFYELILKAHQANLLIAEGAPASPVRQSISWKVGIAWEKAQFLGVFCILFGFFGLLLGNVSLPTNWYDILLGYLVLLASFSAGEILAACVIKAEGLKLYKRIFRWKHPVPHLAFDLSDAHTSGSDTSVTIALVRMAPIFLFAGWSALWYPPTTFILTLGVLLITAPTHSTSPGLQLLRGVQHYAPLDTQRNLLFAPNTSFWAKLYFSIQYADYRYLLVQTAYTAGWLLLLTFILSAQFDINSLDFAYKLFIDHEPDITHPLALITLASLALFTIFTILSQISKHKLSLIKKQGDYGRSTLPHKAPPQSASKIETMRLNPLFHDLPNTPLSEMAEHATTRAYQPGDTIPSQFAIIMEGYVSLKSQEHTSRAILTQGDILGAESLQDSAPEHTAQALTPTTLLSIQPNQYHKIKGLPRPDQATAHQQLRTQLHQIPLFTNLAAHTLTKLLQLAKHSHPTKGQTILSSTKENQFFYILIKGEAQLKRGKKQLKTLTPGHFFGQLSLLQESFPNADVITTEDNTQLLTIQRSNFIKLIANDHHTALVFEEYCSRQLRRPLFPLGSQKATTTKKHTRIISV